MRPTEIEQIQSIILSILRSRFRISTPNNQDIPNSNTRMTDSRTRHLSPRLDQPNTERPTRRSSSSTTRIRRTRQYV